MKKMNWLTQVVTSAAFLVCSNVAFASAGGGDGEVTPPNPLAFNEDLAAWTGVLFVLVFLILWKFAWGPIVQGLTKREEGIANQVADAEKQNAEAKELLAEYKAQLVGAKDEVKQLIEEAKRDARKEGEQIVEAARADARGEQDKALRLIDEATDEALEAIATKSTDMAIQLAGRILQKEIKPDQHAALIDQAVGKFSEN